MAHLNSNSCQELLYTIRPGHDGRRERPLWLLIPDWSVWRPKGPIVGADSLVPDLEKNVFICMCMSVCRHVCWYPWRPEEGVRSLGAGVTGYELPRVGAGN